MKFHRKSGSIIWLFVVFVLMMTAIPLQAAPPDTPNPQAETPKVTVKGNTVNVRGGPGTGYNIVGRTNAGQSYEITGKNQNGSWWEINFGGKKGWISGQLVTTSGNTSSVQVVAAPPLPKAAPAAASAPAAGYFGYGIQIDPNNDRGRAIGEINALGFKWAKVQVRWEDFEGTQGVKNFPDDWINDLSGANLNILATIAFAPAWARSPQTDMNAAGPPADPATYASYVHEFAKRYCGRVQAIEVWNEQNMGYEWGYEPLDPSRYIQLLAAAYRAIKAPSACPQMIVVSGAPTPAGTVVINGRQEAMDDQQYLKAMYRFGLAKYSDAIGVHPSGFNVAPDITWQQACAFISSQGSSFRGPCDSPHPSWSFRSTMEGYRNIMAANGDGRTRLWPTEFGWATNWIGDGRYAYAQDNTTDEQADWTVRAYEMMRNWGWVGPAILWNLNFTDGEKSQWRIQGQPAFQKLAEMPK